jgi:hypothetical protein
LTLAADDMSVEELDNMTEVLKDLELLPPSLTKILNIVTIGDAALEKISKNYDIFQSKKNAQKQADVVFGTAPNAVKDGLDAMGMSLEDFAKKKSSFKVAVMAIMQIKPPMVLTPESAAAWLKKEQARLLGEANQAFNIPDTNTEGEDPPEDPPESPGGSTTKSFLKQLIDDTKANLALFPQMLNQLKGKGIPQQIIEMIGGGEEGLAKAKEILNASKNKLNKLIKDFNKNLINETVKGIQQEKEKLQQQNLSIDILMSRGMSREDATSISSDSEKALAVITAAGDKSGKSIKRLVKELKELKAVPEFVDPIKNKLEEIGNIYKAQMLPLQLKIDKQQEIVDGIQEEIDALEKLNDSDQSRVRDLERQKEMIERQIEEFERLNELDGRRVEILQRQDELRNRESDSLSHELEAMSDIEGKIRETYQERISALEKVSEVNSNILEKQRQQLGLSQALSEGDIYAATAAAQQMRQTDAQIAQEQLRAGLQQGMENSVEGLRTSGGLTREQAEDKIKQIKEQSYQTSLLIRDIEDAIYARTQSMIPLRDQQLVIDRQIRDIADIVYSRETEILGIQNSKLAPAKEILDGYTKQAEELKKNVDIQSALLDGVDLLNDMTEEQIKAAGVLGSTWHEVAKQIQAAQDLAAKRRTSAGAAPIPADFGGNEKKYKAAKKAYEDKIARINSNEQSAIDAAMASGQEALNRNMGGMIDGYAAGGFLKYTSNEPPPGMMKGGVAGNGSRDSVTARLTPGEFVIRKSMVDKYGIPMLSAINQGAYSMPKFNTVARPEGNVSGAKQSSANIVAPMYNNYSVSVNVSGTNASADEIANRTIMKIKQMQNTSIRSGRG